MASYLLSFHQFNIPTSCCKIARPETVQCQAAVRDVRLMSIPKEKIYDKVSGNV